MASRRQSVTSISRLIKEKKMAIQVIEKSVRSSDKEHDLKGLVYLPETEPVGIFEVIHGMVEHIGRYDGFMKRMAEAGYITFAYDHLGHGKTARDESELGYIAPKDGWQRLVDDVALFAASVKEEYGKNLPLTLMGHSMGSFIVRLAAEQYDFHDKLIIMGTGGPNPIAGVGLAMIKMIKKIKGERHVSMFLEKTAFGKYNSRFVDENDPKSWLSTIVEERQKYKNDPFCSFYFTASAMEDLIKLNKLSNRKTWAESLNKKKPVFLVSGSDDPVGDYGKGVETVYKMLKDAGIPATCKIYEGCRHEVLNDICREEAISDILDFCKN